MTKTGCLLSIFMPYAIVKPIDTRFQKAPSPPQKKKPDLPHPLPAQPKNEQKQVLLSMVFFCMRKLSVLNC